MSRESAGSFTHRIVVETEDDIEAVKEAFEHAIQTAQKAVAGEVHRFVLRIQGDHETSTAADPPPTSTAPAEAPAPETTAQA